MLKLSPRAPEESDVVESEPTDRATGSQTVLLVDDEDAFRFLCRKMLESFGYVVLEASGPDRALEIVRGHDGPIHLMVTDIVMPGMDGPELASRLLALRPETSALFMSGYADAATRHGLTDRRRFIQKPFTPDALARKIREALEAEDPN